jgi:hypothetical protein
MIVIILQVILTVVNVIFAIIMYDKGSYKTAIFNAFGAGFCLCGLMWSLEQP